MRLSNVQNGAIYRNLLFIDAADEPDRDFLARIHREETEHEALCFVGGHLSG